MMSYFHVAALVVICAVAVFRINMMTPRTPRRFKVAYIAMASGAFSEGIAILLKDPSGAIHALLVVGIAAVLVVERRHPRCYLPEDCE